MRILSLVLVTLFLASCGGVKRTGGPGSPSLVKVFSKPNGSTMYFAGPVYYEQDGGKAQLEMDYTYSTGGEEPVVVCNFTLEHPTLASFQPESIKWIPAEGTEVQVKDFEEFFREKTKVYRYRYSTFILLDDWITFMENEDSYFLLNEMRFEHGKKHKKHRQMILDQVVFPVKSTN